MRRSAPRFGSVFQPFSKQVARSGFSLVEVMVVIGIMAVMGLAFSTMMVNSAKQAKSVSQKGDFNSLINELQAYFNNSGNCIAAFGGAGGTTLNASIKPTSPQNVSIVLGSGTTLKGGPNEFYGKGGDQLKIDKVHLVNEEAVSGSDQKLITLEIAVDRGEAAVGGRSLGHKFPILVNVDSSRKIQGCYGQYDNLWVHSANSANIHYSSGSVGIGTDDPKEKLDVAGTIQATAFMYKSDLRLKQNVREISNALERVSKLHGVLFDWKDQDGLTKSTDQLGLIAQEVEQIFPEAVVTNPQTGMKSVAYGNLVSPLIEALRTQQRMIESQQKEIDEIKKAISTSRE